jgi:hypothetical protein
MIISVNKLGSIVYLYWKLKICRFKNYGLGIRIRVPTRAVGSTDFVAMGFNPLKNAEIRQFSSVEMAIRNLIGHPFINGLKPVATKWVEPTALVCTRNDYV